MGSLDLNDKEFHEWAVKKLAEDTRLEELEEFCTKYPPNELKHIFTVLDAKVIPILHSEGIPITQTECFKLFRAWFVRVAIATQNATPKDNTREGNTTNFFVAQLCSSFLYTEYNIQSFPFFFGWMVVDGRRQAPAVREPDHHRYGSGLQPAHAPQDA